MTQIFLLTCVLDVANRLCLLDLFMYLLFVGSVSLWSEFHLYVVVCIIEHNIKNIIVYILR